MALFDTKKGFIRCGDWQERKDIISRGTHGTPELNSLHIQRGRSPTDGITENGLKAKMGIGS